jgi:Tfp pilus assembly protein PilF
VFVLTATHHRVPRWFAEGLAVHEEGEANRAWANRLTPDIVIALQQKKLLPIADLDRGFVHPDYPEQILVSYYQAGRICDYIQSRWGADKLVDMVKAFAEVRPTGTVLQDVLGLTPQAFDQEFLAWLNKDVGGVVAGFDEWRTRMKKLVDLFGEGQYDEALVEAENVRQLYPEYVEEANPYELIADIQTKKGDKARAVAVLLEYQKFGGENPATLKKLAALQEESGQLDKAASTLNAINDIYPVNDEELHRHLGDLRAKQNDNEAAVREYASVVALHPLDKAGAMFNLARAYFTAHQYDKAEESVLAALEAAPGYRPAQQLLLQIEDAKPQRADERCAAPACSPNR